MVRDISRAIVLCGVFVLPLLPLIVSNSLFFPFITGKNFIFRIVVEMMFGAWILLALYDSRYRPKFSWILGSMAWLLLVMALADAFGVSPMKSFWSNYERMDGFVTLLHLGLYLLVTSSVLTTEKMWNYFLNTTVFVAIGMMLYGFCQLSGSASCPISQSDFRIDGRMGNAAYLAIYMFFHVFIALFLLTRAKTRELRIFYIVLALGFAFILVKTGTRGTLLALAGGVFLSGAYIALFEKYNPMVRKTAIGMIAAVIIVAGGFYAARDTTYVKSSPILNRMTQISLSDLTTRFTIWKLAVDGVKERPILGWGQENFNYVFNQNYKASLYAQEPWFDRVHDIAFDWLIAGGILGFIAYALLFLSALYYVAIRPLHNKLAETYSVTERGVLFGLLAGYTVHNLVVFDNLISYYLFFSILAMLHARFATDIPSVQKFQVEDAILKNIAFPTVLVLTCALVYYVNIPSMQAAGDLIKAFQGTSPEARLESFKTALGRGSFGQQEIREQLVRMTQDIVQNPSFPQQLQQTYPSWTQEQITAKANEIRTAYVTLADSELNAQVAETPNDARVLVFQSSFYRVIGKPDDAIRVLERAVALSPEKQQILFELGLAYLQKGDAEKSKATLKRAFDLEPKNVQARLFYASVAIQTGDVALEKELLTSEYENDIVSNDTILQSFYQKKNFVAVLDLLGKRIERSPGELQLRVSYAAVQNEAGDRVGAIKTVEETIALFPDFKTQGEGFIAELNASQTPVKK